MFEVFEDTTLRGRWRKGSGAPDGTGGSHHAIFRGLDGRRHNRWTERRFANTNPRIRIGWIPGQDF
jgi:hypothetical protein